MPLKPEVILVAQKKPALIVKPAAKKPQKHHKPKKLRVAKYARIRVKKPIFYSIISVVVAIAVAVTWALVSQSVRETNTTLNESSRVANATYLVAKKQASLIKIIGTKLQRQSEIQNYQSAPNDLQKFMADDYRLFKQQCIANGVLAGDIGYELHSVVYDSFAVIKRSCNGVDTLIAKKFETKWATVFSGNILPPCSLTNDLAIPQGASYYCQQNEVRYVNPNP